MTMLLGVVITCALLAAWGIAFTRHALRHDIPGSGFLDRLPDPAVLLRSLMPRRRPRIATRGRHHVGPVRFDLATATLPRLRVDGAPPWTTAPQPELDGEAGR